MTHCINKKGQNNEKQCPNTLTGHEIFSRIQSNYYRSYQVKNLYTINVVMAHITYGKLFASLFCLQMPDFYYNVDILNDISPLTNMLSLLLSSIWNTNNYFIS